MNVGTFTIDTKGLFPVDARELHMNLGVGRDFSTWIRERIERFSFLPSIDFKVFPRSGENPTGGRPSQDYGLSVSAAKMIAAVENTPVGRSVLSHLVQIEAAWNTPEMILVRAHQAAEVLLDRLRTRVAELEIDAEAARVISCASGLKTLSEIGKINKIGPRKLFEILEERDIIFRLRGCWVPFQRYIDRGFFEVKESAVGRRGEEFLRSQTYVTGKGELWLAKQLFPVDAISQAGPGTQGILI